MTTTGSNSPTQADPAQPVFRSVLCGIARNRADAEATRQAAVLAGSGSLHLLCAWYDAGTGLAAQATLTEESAKSALEKARAVAVETCRDVHVASVLSDDAIEALLEEGPRHDLVVVGAPGRHRSEGIFLGSVATNLAHRLTVPLLVARPAGADFPTHVVVASDGSGSAHTAVRTAARVARQHAARLTLVHVDGQEDRHLKEGLARDSAELFEELGVEPVTVYERGDPVEGIVRVAEREDASIVVVGNRGLTGVKALGSVSERVVHAAPCSVLVTRHP